MRQTRLACLMTRCQRLETQCHHLQVQSKHALQQLNDIWERRLQEWIAGADQ
jgi:hypothetical protein